MKKPKVCLGCFLEWEVENCQCPHCGWDYEKKESSLLKWNVGEVLEKRYLVGKTCYRTAEITIWRMYDNILGCPVWVLYGKGMSKDGLWNIALRLDEAVILAVKQIDKRDVMVFSLKNRMLKDELLEECLFDKESVYTESRQEDMRMGNKENSSQGSAAEEENKVSGQNCLQPEVQRDHGHNIEVALTKLLPEDSCLDNRYRIEKTLGIGGFGITYLCEDINLHRKVAVKEYFPEQWAERDGTYVAVKKSSMLSAFQYGMKSFCKEIQITAKFIHTSHIVTIFDAFEDNDTMYMVMEYIDGISIGKELRQREYQPYTIAEMAKIILPLLDALEKIHEKSIIHSDISPGNIIRAKNGEIVLIDMGAAKYTVDSQAALSAAFLKIEYAAPEQYQTAREGITKGEGAWTDIYAVGATMYYLLTGHKPIDAIRRLSSKNQDYVSPEKFKVKISRKWLSLIHHAAALDRKERISSVVVLRKKIQELLG